MKIQFGFPVPIFAAPEVNWGYEEITIISQSDWEQCSSVEKLMLEYDSIWAADHRMIGIIFIWASVILFSGLWMHQAKME